MTNLRSTLPLLLLAAGPLAAQHQAQNSPQTPSESVGSPQQKMLQWGDFDADGLADALVITPDQSLTLMRNSGDGSFEDVTDATQLGEISGALFATWKDYDQDGQIDLFIGTQSGPSHLLRNTGGSFHDVTAQAGIDAVGKDQSARWFDYDMDGHLDLHLSFDQNNVLYHSLSTGAFERVELPSMLENTAGSSTTVFINPQAIGGTALDQSTQASGTEGNQVQVVNGRRTIPASSSTSTPNQAGDVETHSGGTTSSAMAGPTFTGICAQSVRDFDGGGCLRASSEATLGMLYPLSEDFFIEESSGRVGVGTVTPSSTFHVAGNGPVPMLIEAPDSAGLQINSVTSSSNYTIAQTLDSALTFSGTTGVPLMRLESDAGTVDIPNLVVDSFRNENDNRVEGFIRSGSELGTTQPPDTAFVDYAGMVIRRIISATTISGSIVALSTSMRLVRDGTVGRFTIEWDANAVPEQMVYGTGLTESGATIPIIFNFGGPGTAGSQQLYTDDTVLRLDLVFGSVFNTRDLTEITLVRSANDFWWHGSVRSTVNQ